MTGGRVVKKSLESTYPRPEGVALRPIHGFATAISKAFLRQSHLTLTTPKGRGFLHWIKDAVPCIHDVIVGGDNLVEDIFAIERELVSSDHRSSQHFNWLQLLRALVPNQPTVREIFLVPSSESIRYVDECAAIVRCYVPEVQLHCTSRKSGASTGEFVFLTPEKAAEESRKSSPKFAGANFEDPKDLAEAYHAVFLECTRRDRDKVYQQHEIVFDVTGGMRPASIAGAAVTLNNDAHVQYVPPKEIREYGEAPTPESEFYTEVRAYDLEARVRPIS